MKQRETREIMRKSRDGTLRKHTTTADRITPLNHSAEYFLGWAIRDLQGCTPKKPPALPVSPTTSSAATSAQARASGPGSQISGSMGEGGGEWPHSTTLGLDPALSCTL
ncbi:hypothetical protein GWK47_005595 [Chionoecetes opilio]|uniref:Uncharacterized protein n=1 Tax=Chionoecetes opilio TaxID=41210 RepID=A0A8J4YAX6_CHIOP|nr:hypothetical protein GWK47_005595 [Chionoecetes opilio]